MNERILRADKLGKRYDLTASANRAPYSTIRESAARAVRRAFRQERGPETNEFWALRDLSFEIDRGDVVGIVGRNGAGKSTLLKVLSRITPPTTGTVSLRGRVASLLEVGTGFHPELTGRENIFLNGAILGMSRREIVSKFDEIVAFAEVEKFLDLPIKRYSSGMYVRLAFAVAAHLDPDILIVDEVLAVGDAAFQKKCLGKMQSVAQGGGRTVLLVSHNMGHLTAICNRAIWLRQGQVVMQGDCNKVISSYLRDESERSGAVTFTPREAPVSILSASIRMRSGEVSASLDVREPFTVELEFKVSEPVSGADISIRVTNSSGVPVFSSNRARFLGEDLAPGVYRNTIELPAEFLIPDDYALTIGGFRMGGEIYFVEESCLAFSVEETGSHMARFTTSGSRIGIVLVHFPWQEASRA